MKFESLNSDIFLSERKFFDDKNFPYGFHRSGDFTIAEADLLSRYGVTMKKLVNGELQPSRPEQERFIQVIKGREEPRYAEESIYLKYMRLIAEKEKTFPPVRKVKAVLEESLADGDGDDSEDFL